MVRLSERLQNVADLITPGRNVADVGCDHGYLSIYLMQADIAKTVIASDVRKGPLSKAKENIETYEMEDRIETRLSDGLSNISKGEVDCVVMSGMGGNLMMEILERGKTVLEDVKELVLQPQSEIRGLRHYLQDNGYMIISEAMVYEDDKYYPMMKACKEQMNWDQEIYFIYGKILLREQNPVLHQFLLQERDFYVNLYSELCCQSPTENVVARLRDVEETLKYNNEALELIEAEFAAGMERKIK
ncbi:MAG: class I SAM-dependent methyltransferase [Lachnospiraceae bacterium]|nr:class I SAM-dependent methyltransferase [Lachnospiraceae bacterium]